MRVFRTTSTSVFLLTMALPLFGQSVTNCFLKDAASRVAVVPDYYIDSVKTTAVPTATVVINAADTLAEVSPYLLGNAVAVWVGANIDNPTMVNHINLLSPDLIRFPGGSWSDIYFFNGNPGDLPDSLPDGTTYNYTTGGYKKYKFTPQFGPNQPLTPAGYYDLRKKTGTQGLITVNYAYARYGQSAHPVQQAAHLAAEWVRYDSGRTKFWEIGNEDSAPWEAGWLIDTSQNDDGQPPLISGTLYGEQFKVFADSMRAAAEAMGDTIYIGAIVIQNASTFWIPLDKTWNQELFKEIGDSADFYVIHDYFGVGATDITGAVIYARPQIIADIAYVRNDISTYGAAPKPIALTEWNCSSANSQGSSAIETSIANGMQAVAVFCDMAANGMGMSTRWLLANWDADGMFYYKSPPATGVPLWNPRPDFYYLYYLKRFLGDHVVRSSVSGNGSIIAYATTFSSGQTSVIVLNTGSSAQVIKVEPRNIGVGGHFYVYTLTGSNSATWPQTVSVNGDSGGTTNLWGPLNNLEYDNIPAIAYPVGDTVVFNSPAYSVEYVLIDSGGSIISSINGNTAQIPDKFEMDQNYPNPFNPTTLISYQLPFRSHVIVKVYDVLGRIVTTLVDAEQSPGHHSLTFNGSDLASGVYFCRLRAGAFEETKKLLLMK